jgi:hypothetical protein
MVDQANCQVGQEAVVRARLLIMRKRGRTPTLRWATVIG